YASRFKIVPEWLFADDALPPALVWIALLPLAQASDARPERLRRRGDVEHPVRFRPELPIELPHPLAARGVAFFRAVIPRMIEQPRLQPLQHRVVDRLRARELR